MRRPRRTTPIPYEPIGVTRRIQEETDIRARMATRLGKLERRERIAWMTVILCVGLLLAGRL